MSSLYKRGKHWHLQWMQPDGEKRQRSTGIRVSDDPRGMVARQVQRDHDSAAIRTKSGIEDERLTVGDAFRRWLPTIRQTTERYQVLSATRAKRWEAFLGERGVTILDEINHRHVGEWIEARRKDGRSGKTIRMDLDVLRGAVKLANRSRKINPIPIDSWPKVERTTTARPDRVGAYSASDVEAILDHLGKWKRRRHWVLPVYLLAHIGCRWGELAALTVGDIDLSVSPPSVRIESHKTARSRATQHRWVEIHPEIVEELTKLTAGRKPSEKLIELPDQHNATNVLRRACEKLGIRYRRLHGLRHYWITSLLSAGVPLAIVMAMAGHRNLSTTQGYLTLSDRNAGWIQRLPNVSKNVSKSEGK